MQIYIVRHAQTKSNLTRRLQGSGSASTELTLEGHQEAQALATYLKQGGATFEAIYSSDATRAQQTATTLGAALVLPVKLEPSLREIDCGVWEDKSHDELTQLYPEEWGRWRSDPLAFRFPQGEGLLDVQRRVGTFFDNVVLSHAPRNVLLVSHSATISALMAYVHGWDLLEAWLEGRAIHRNTAFSVLTFGVGSKRPVHSAIALTHHLPD